MKTCAPILLLLVALGGGAPTLGQPPPRQTAEVDYRLIKEVPLIGEGDWGSMTVEPAGRRLYLAHSQEVIVIDLDQDTLVGRVSGMPGVRDFAVAPELGRGFAANSRENKAVIVDLKTLSPISKVATGEEPGAILFEPRQREVYVFNRRGQSVTVFAAETGQAVALIPLPGRPESAVVDPKAARVFCTIVVPNSEEHEVAALEFIKEHAVADHWATPPGLEPGGLAIDAARHRLLVGCNPTARAALTTPPPTGFSTTNGQLIMMSGINGQITTKLRTGLGLGGLAFDPVARLVFGAAGREGNVVIAHQNSAELLSLAQVLPAARGLRTLAVDPKTHKLYVPTAEFEATLAPAPGMPAARPRPIAGTFKLLVFGPGP